MITPAEFKRLIDFAYRAHQEQVKPDAADLRREGVPFVAHPLWCALMVLNDNSLTVEQRRLGFQALLLYDVLEDTTAELPDDLEPEVVRLVHDMTYGTWEQEVEEVPQKDTFVQFLKVVDKVATLYDGGPRPSKRPSWIAFTEQLIEAVEPEFGESTTLAIAKVILEKTR